MHLRVATVRRDGKVYRYGQLVQSYRREDGKPAHRLLASLGAMGDVEIANLREALGANRRGSALVLAAPSALAAAGSTAPTVEANLRYLDLAVVLRQWQALGLDALLQSVLPAGGEAVAAADVVAALVCQRCSCPGSKLAASRWYPTTALPELQGLGPGRFNNTRVHRVLSSLEVAEPELLERLPGVLERPDAAFSRFFVDATDTWFEGHGPPLAAPGKDKVGVWRRRVGIVLLCDQLGRPVRWHTLDGRYHDGTALLEMVSEASRLPWVGACPIVLDRAVGGAGSIEQLVASGTRFLTALPRQEFASSGAPIPWDAVEALQEAALSVDGSPERIASRAAELGFSALSADRFVRDLGTFEKSRPAATSRVTRAVLAIRAARHVAAHPHARPADLMKMLGCSHTALRRYRALTGLLPELQARILAGEADRLALDRLGAIARTDADEQQAAFTKTLAESAHARPIFAQAHLPGAVLPGWPLRAVLSFSVSRLRDDAERVEKGMAEVSDHAARINRRLRTHPQLGTDGQILGRIAGTAKKAALGDVYDFRIDRAAEGSPGRALIATINHDALARRRRTAGIALLVGHEDIPGTAADIAAMYTSKDAIEKDFQTIKSVLDMHPVRHRTDEKVRAHVTLCMLALLVERTLHHRLRSIDEAPSAVGALTECATLHLNRVTHAGVTSHALTTPTPAQRRILQALHMEELIDPGAVAARITPR
jgi:hypothetical protein